MIEIVYPHLPARFDWSIIGWTILRRALMNLQNIKTNPPSVSFCLYLSVCGLIVLSVAHLLNS